MKLHCYILGWLLLGACLLQAQAPVISKARSFATSGEHQLANKLLTNYLKDHPKDLDARILRAHNLSWWKHYDESILAFEEILADHPASIDALSGLGHAYLWSNQIPAAIKTFRKARQVSPTRTDVRHGLGLAYLRTEQGKEAAAIFSDLISRFPGNTSFQISLSKALLISGRKRESKKILQQVLASNPDHQEAQFLLTTLTQGDPSLEFDLWGGYSKVGQTDEWGLRQAQLSYHFNRKYTLLARYDNTLSMDNRDFILRNERASTGWLGGYFAWDQRHATRFDVGRRFFDSRNDQLLFKGEQIFFLDNGFSLKAGGLAGFAADVSTEWFFLVGGRIPINSVFALEPTYYYGRDNSQFDGQHRVVLAGQLKFATGLEMNLGAFWGRADVGLEQDQETVKGAYLLAFYPISKRIWSQFAINHEEGVFDDATIFSFGLRFRLDHP